jgi:hypothetical protein
MPTVKNLSAGEVIPQMGFAPSQNQNGGWEATRDYYMLASTWEGASVQNRFARGTSITTADPSIPSVYSFLTVESKIASYEDSGTIRLSVRYTGSASPQFGGDGGGDLTLAALPIYRLDGRLRELSVSDHPKYRALDDRQQWLLGGLLDGKWETNELGLFAYGRREDGTPYIMRDADGGNLEFEEGDSSEFAKKISRGEVTYQAPSLVWTEITQGDTGMTANQLGKLGEISDPRGDPPTIDGYDWLLTGASQEQRGELYQTTLEWTLSTPDGWDAFLYSET